MNGSRSTPRTLIGLFGAVAILVAACGSASTSPAASTAASTAPAASAPAAAAESVAPTATPIIVTPEPVAAGPGPNGGKVVRWFIGLGAGTQPQHLKPEADWVKAYNDSQKDVYIILEIVDNSIAAAQLKTESPDLHDFIETGTAGHAGLETPQLMQIMVR